MPTIQAQDIVNAVIQDSQNLTTNRAALYDYTDRIHQRVLRESQWRFLTSDPQSFVTLPGVAGYGVTSTAPPPGVFRTGLELTDFGNFIPGSVFNATDWKQMEEDSDGQLARNTLTNKDGSLRTGIPRTFSLSISNPGTISLSPAPDSANTYYPIPETPVVTFAPATGCLLPNRIYFGVVTFVDNFGGEGTACVVPFTVAVPAGNVLTVSSPSISTGGIAGNQAIYGFWNLYIGTAINAYYIQDITPTAIGTSWTEPITGVWMGLFPIPSTASIPVNTSLAITSNGLLTTTIGALSPVYPWALKDSSGGLWQILSSGGIITTTYLGTVPGVGVRVPASVTLVDSSGQNTWQISVLPSGLLQTTKIASTPLYSALYQNPPTTPTLQPLNAYVIQFRYQKLRTTLANPTDVLQIPYQYKDVVIAGVNYYANLYMDPLGGGGRSAKAEQWKRDFEAGLAQIRRDIRINYRKTDFVSPDPSTQTFPGNQQGIPTMGW